MQCLLPYVCFLFLRWVKFCCGCFRQVVFFDMVALDRWSSYTVMILWKLAWGDSTLVILDGGSSYRGGRLNRFDCTFQMDAKFARLWKIVKSFSFVTKMVSSVKNHKNLQFSWLCMYLLLPHWIEYHQILHGGVWHMWSCNL